MDKKRILLIIGFVLTVILLGWALWRVFFAPPKKSTTTKQPPTSSNTTIFPSSDEGTGLPKQLPPTTILPTSQTSQTGSTAVTTPPPTRTNQLIESPISSPTKDSLGASKFYSEQDGKFYRVNANGEITPLSDTVFFNVKHVVWSPTKNESIIEYPDGANIYYNFDTKKQVTLPKHWEEFSFAPAGDTIAAKSMGLSAENRWLITSDPTGNNIQLIEPMGDNADKVIVDWSPNRQVVALSTTGQALGADRQEVLFVGLNGENFPSMNVEGRGLQSQWSPKGDKLLYSVFSARSDFKPELWIVNAEGQDIGSGRKILGVNTWSDKCSFADDRFVYCAVPDQLPIGAGFAPSLADESTDTLYRIDTQTGIKNPIVFDDNTPHTVQTLFIGAGGRTLYFSDTNRAGLFEVAL